MVSPHIPLPSSFVRPNRLKTPLIPLFINGAHKEEEEEEEVNVDTDIDPQEFDFSDVFGALPPTHHFGMLKVEFFNLLHHTVSVIQEYDCCLITFLITSFGYAKGCDYSAVASLISYSGDVKG